MARKGRSKSPKRQESQSPASKKQEKKETKTTLEEIEQMSDSDEEEIAESQWSTKAKNLRQAIKDGKFDNLVEALKASNKGKEGDDDEFEEDTLGSSDDEDIAEDEADVASEEDVDEMEAESGDEVNDSEDENEVEENGDEEESDEEEVEEGEGIKTAGVDSEDEDEDAQDDEEKEEESEEEEAIGANAANDNSEEEDDEEEEESDEEDETDGKTQQLRKNNENTSKALAVVTAELVASHAHLPWSETFDIFPPTPLPFGDKAGPDGNPLDIHDDLKREVAFYESALEAVHEARAKCRDAGIPFSRPEDFFAEMVKTDDHMAKVKDRLIFETKKMEAVAQRKSNREQKLRAKESQANKAAEKAKRKREHFQQVEEWANSAARNRGGALPDKDDDMFQRQPNKKRQIADRKYGFGGKKGRFKQNDRASMNDISGYNPRGNFGGMGTKKTAKSASGKGAARTGKRARDAKRSRR